MNIQDFIDSGFIGKSVDKIKGSSVGIFIDQGSKEVYADSSAEAERQEVEKLTGKKIWVVVKGTSACRDFIKSLIDVKNPEVKQIGGGYYEVPFDDFSLYHKPLDVAWSEVLMDAREVILPPKKTIEYGPSRGYVVSVRGTTSFKYYFCPYLQYPASFAPFFKWLVKKKKITISKGEAQPLVWNKDKLPKNLIEWYHQTMFLTGVPMKNIKAEDDLEIYNEWLKTVVVPYLDSMKKKDGGKTFGQEWLDHISCPDNVSFTVLTGITQEVVDEYMKEANGVVYKVLR